MKNYTTVKKIEIEGVLRTVVVHNGFKGIDTIVVSGDKAYVDPNYNWKAEKVSYVIISELDDDYDRQLLGDWRNKTSDDKCIDMDLIWKQAFIYRL